jgi:hypothetical protein
LLRLSPPCRLPPPPPALAAAQAECAPWRTANPAWQRLSDLLMVILMGLGLAPGMLLLSAATRVQTFHETEMAYVCVGRGAGGGGRGASLLSLFRRPTLTHNSLAAPPFFSPPRHPHTPHQPSTRSKTQHNPTK